MLSSSSSSKSVMHVRISGSFLEVAKLNGRGDADVAVFLGSSQSDPAAEERALRGEFRLVYITPEKLTGNGDGTFLERLANMHSGGGRGRICLVAVDESHCVSEWGHDFRPAFLRIGPALRGNSVLRSIPILALTATAVPRVREDILKNLRMNRDETTIVRRSFDRTNLKIVVRGKPGNGITGAFEGIATELALAIVAKRGTVGGGGSSTKAVGAGKSTIVYCSTKREVDDVAAKISQLLAHQLVRLMQQQPTDGAALDQASELASTHVRAYHAGLSHFQRTEGHTGFLIGRVSIIVATVAFGMGIDKPDIRRVFHWGAPKTVEEYYQQMGRAGRDGLPAECTMFVESNDFVKYKDEFYLGGLTGGARAATVRSMDALRDFAMRTSGCRRASLLDFFEEVPSFGKFCGTCDLCLSRKDHGDDYERDFQWEGARVILKAVMACPNQVSTPRMRSLNDSYGFVYSSFRQTYSIFCTIDAITHTFIVYDYT